MTEVDTYNDTKQVLFSHTPEFIHWELEEQILSFDEGSVFNEALQMIDSRDLYHTCNDFKRYKVFIERYDRIIATYIHAKDRQYFTDRLLRNEKTWKIAVPFKLYFLYTEEYMMREKLDLFKAKYRKVYTEERYDHIDPYYEELSGYVEFRMKVAYRGTYEEHYVFENEDDFEAVQKVISHYSNTTPPRDITRKWDDFIWRKMYIALDMERKEDIHERFEEHWETIWCPSYKLKSSFTKHIERYEEWHDMLNHIIVLRLFFKQFYSLIIGNDFGVSPTCYSNDLRICNAKDVWSFITWPLFSGNVYTMNFQYDTAFSDEQATIINTVASKISKLIEEEKLKEWNEKLLDQIWKLILQSIKDFNKTEYRITTRNWRLDALETIITEKDPKNFEAIHSKIPDKIPVYNQKVIWNKPMRIYKTKKELWEENN